MLCWGDTVRPPHAAATQVTCLRDGVPSRGTVLLHISAVAAHEHLRRPPAGHQHLSAQRALRLAARQHICAGHSKPVRMRLGPLAMYALTVRCGGPVGSEAQGAPSSVVLPLPLGPIYALRSPCKAPTLQQLEKTTQRSCGALTSAVILPATMQPDTLSSRGSFSALLALLVTRQLMSYSPAPL